jgi:pyruvate dehydrogenase E2 component (dihydrolipoamide acetyltransferase)/2-oxoisovalerate dehydrogenase E2 component (dihydrolipoyl transacylase)
MARKLGIDLGAVHGSGPEGRILLNDLTTAAGTTDAKPHVTEYGKPGTRLKLVGLRRKIAEHMTLAKRTIPHYSYVDECDVTELVRLRDSLKETYATAGVKLTFLAFAVKAVVAALKEVPLVNASLDEEKGEIVLHDRYHIGIAVATPAGLIVPVVRDADRKSLGEIARALVAKSTAVGGTMRSPDEVATMILAGHDHLFDHWVERRSRKGRAWSPESTSSAEISSTSSYGVAVPA